MICNYKLLNEESSEAIQAIYRGGRESFFDEGVFICRRKYLRRFTKASSSSDEGIFIRQCLY